MWRSSIWQTKSFTITDEFEAQELSSPILIGILTILKCISGPNWEIFEAQNEAKLNSQVKFYLKSQGQLPHKTIEILTKVVCTPGPNLNG